MEEDLVVIGEARDFQGHRVAYLVSAGLRKLEGLIGGEDLEHFDRVRADHLTDEHLVVTEGFILSLSGVLEVQLLEYVEVTQIEKIPLGLSPNLCPVAVIRKLDTHKLCMVVRPRVVNHNQEFRG